MSDYEYHPPEIKISVYQDGELIVTEPPIEFEDTQARLRTLKPNEIAVDRDLLRRVLETLKRDKRTISDLILNSRQLGWNGLINRLSGVIGDLEQVLRGQADEKH